MYSRSKRKILCPSSTSGSRSLMSREHSTRSSASLIVTPESTVLQPEESAIAMAMIRSDSRRALGNSNSAVVVTSMSTAIQRRESCVAREALEQIGIGQEQEGPERLLSDHDTASAPRIHPHRGLGGVEGEQSAARVMAEEHRVVVEGERERAQLSMPRRRCNSLRASV